MGWTCLFCALATTTAAQPATLQRDAYRLLVEAEQFDGLVFAPCDRPELSQWYAREANCRHFGAPGQGCAAAIHETAPPQARTIGKRLKSPIPPGKYKAAIRVTGTQWFDRENIVHLKVGDAPPLEFKWTVQGRFSWLPPAEIELARPADTLTLTAVQFGGKGVRILYECQARSIWVDSIYITSDLSESKGPTLALERCVAQGRPLPEDVLSGQTTILDVPLSESDETPPPNSVPVAGVVRLQPLDGRRNLLPNSSFELGMNDGWAATNLPYRFCHVFTSRDEDAQNPLHGRYCLHVPAGAKAFSRVYALAEGGPMTLSVHARAAEDGVAAQVSLIAVDQRKNRGEKPLLTVPCKLSRSWQRFHASGEVPAGQVAIQVDSAAQLWLDAMQLERGPLTDYAPRAEIEVGLSTGGALGNVLDDASEPQLTVRLHNSGPRPRRASLAYRIVDVSERVVREAATPEQEVAPGQTATASLGVGAAARGLYSATYGLSGRPGPEGEVVYAVLPKLRPGKARHELGANMDALPAAYELMARCGFRWQLYCKLPTTSARNVAKKPGAMDFPDAQVRLGQHHGLTTLPCLWPTHVPEWMTDPDRKEGLTKEVTRKLKTACPRLDAWSEFVRAMGARYKDVVRAWTVEDEVEMYYTARDYAPIVEAAATALHAADPKLRVTLSGMPEYTEELLTYVDPKLVDGFGASSYGLEHWDSRKIRHLKERFGKTWYCIGVGADRQPTMYHTLPEYQPVYSSAAKTARELVYLSIVQDADVIGHYTGRLWNRHGHYNTDFPLVDYDGTPLPHGFSYACLGLLLANAVPQGDVALGNLGPRAYLFRLGDRLGAATWSTAVVKYDHLWKPSKRQFGQVALHGIRQGDIDLLDMYFNPHPDQRWTADGLQFDLDEAPVFLMNRRLDEVRFRRMLAAAVAPPDPIAGRVVFLPGAAGGVDLGVVLRNQTDRPLEGVRIDARMPYDRPLSKSEWILKQLQAQVPKLASGATQIVRLPTVIAPGQRVENATFTLTLDLPAGRRQCLDDVGWLAWAPRCPQGMKLDGDLAEWSGRSAAWIYVTWAWSRLGRDYCQIYDGGEHISYCTKIDVRAVAWAAHDETRLLLALRVDDDQVLPPEEKIVVRLDADPARGPQAAPADSELVLVPNADGSVDARLTRAGKETRLAQAACKIDKTGYAVELAVSLEDLGLKGRPGTAVGFDFLVHDTDLETGVETSKTVGVVRWAGQSQGGGQLIFHD